MELQHPFDPQPHRPFNDGPPSGGSLDRQRGEIDRLLRESDHVFDSISQIQAHQYVEQTVQIGGQ